MTVGSFVFMLHGHLPFYRKAGMWPFGEENLYECMSHSYIPLLNAINELLDEGIKAKLTVGLTPVLAEQLNDEHLKAGFDTYINSRLEAIQEDLNRYPSDSVAHSQHLEYLARFYNDWYNNIKDSFINRYNRDLISEFRRLQDLGCIEITTSCATHGFMPLLSKDSSINAQLKTGVNAYKNLFGRKPRGAWMPECAYRPGYEATAPDGSKYYRPAIETHLANNDIEYVFVESHQVEGGVSVGSRRSVGIYGNIEYIPLPPRPATGLTTYEAYWMPEAQVAVMGRNHEGGYQVWSAADGYPGDGCYREFHKKDENSGAHYWRITSPTCGLGEKMLYDPVLAQGRINENTDHYTNIIYHRLNDYKKATGKDGLFMVAFDAELFGHWWFEGVDFIKQVIKKLHNHLPEVKLQTASEYLDEHQPSAAVQLPESSWGQGGHFWVWQNHQTEWMWPIIHSAERRVENIVSRYPQVPQDKLLHRALNQLVRENLLLQSSDWPFLVTTWQARDYAVERFRKHQENFETLAAMIENNSIDDGYLQSIESVDNLFSEIDYRVFTQIKEGKLPQETEELMPLYM